MSKKGTRKRPTEISWDSDDDLLKEDHGSGGVSAFNKTKIEEEDIDEDALLGISGDNNKPVVYELEGDEEVGEGDFFQIVDPEESTAFDDGSQLGLAGNQTELEVLDYEDTVQEDIADPSDVVFDVKTQDSSVNMSRPSTGISSGAFKDRTRPESDSDEDKEDHRERFKSERKMITLKSTKYTKPIPETLEFTPEMQEEINKFEKKAPVKQRLGQKGNQRGNQKRGQGQRGQFGQFGPRFSGNQNIRGQRMNQRPQWSQMQRGQFAPRQPQRGPVPRFPHEITVTTTQEVPPNQVQHPGPPVSVMGQIPQLMQETSRPNVHLNPHFRGPVPVSQPFTSQPQPLFPPGQRFHPPPQAPPDNFPRPAWSPQHPSPTPEGYPPPQQPSQHPFPGQQPPYPPVSVGFNPRPGPPQPLIPTSIGLLPNPHSQQPNIIPQNAPLRPEQQFRPPFSAPQGVPPNHGPPPHHPQHPNFQPQRFGPPEIRPGFNPAPPNQHPHFRPMAPPQQRPPSPHVPGGPVRPQVEQPMRPLMEHQLVRPQMQQPVRPQMQQQVRAQSVHQRLGPQGDNNRHYGGQIRQQGRQIQAQVGFKRPQVVHKLIQKSRQVQLPNRGQRFNPTQGQLSDSQTKVQGNIIPVVSSRGVKRRSTETPDISPAKQIKKEPEPVPMEVVDPELQQALDQQKKQREAIKAKKEANRLAIAAKRRLELEEKLAKQGLTLDDLDKPKQEQQGQKISVLGQQYTSTNTNQPNTQFTNLVQLPPEGAGRGQIAQGQDIDDSKGHIVQGQARGGGRGQIVQGQVRGGGRGQSVQGQIRGRGRGQIVQGQLRGRGGQIGQGQMRGGRGFNNQGPVRGVGRGQFGHTQAGAAGRGQHVPGAQQNNGSGQTTPVPFRGAGRGQRGRGLMRGQNKRGGGPKQLFSGNQQGQQNAPFKVPAPGQPHKKQQELNKQGQGQLKGVTIVRKDNKGGVIQTYNALPTKDAHGKTVFKLKKQDSGGQGRKVQAGRTVVAGSGSGGQGHVDRQVIAHSTPQPSRTVVASSNTPRTIFYAGNTPHVRSRKIAVEGLTSTTQEGKLRSMVDTVGGGCESIKILPQQRRAILTFHSIDMATKFVKKYNRSMVDLTKILVKEIPE